MLVAGLALGFAIALLVTGRWSPDRFGEADQGVQAAADAPQAVVTQDGAADAPDEATGAAAASGRRAVDGFLTAETTDAYTTSFSFLSAADRETFRSPAGWEAAHADVLPSITDFTIRQARRTDQGVEVVTDLQMQPGLDEVVGLVPGAATATWLAVEEPSGRWGVDLEASTLEPRYPADAAAADAAAAWVRARQRCERSNRYEYRDGLIGPTAPVERLCRAAGPVEASIPQPLADLDAGPFEAAFGGDVTSWARVVEVTAPDELRVVLAPVGERWLVIGVLASPAG